MSRSEEVEAYTKILKFQNKRYGLGIRDIVILLFGVLILVGGSFWLAGQSEPQFATLYFILMAIYLLLLSITFFDYALGIGLFTNNQVVVSGIIVITTVLLSVIATVFASTLYGANDAELASLLALVIYLSTSFIISYFIHTATPTRQGRDEMIQKLSEIRHEIEKMPIGQLGSKDATRRGLKWLQFQQREDGIWGDTNPLYETAVVLRTFSTLKEGLDYSWTRIVNGQEEVRTVEQTYYLVLEALETAAIEPSYEMLLPFQAVTEINPEQIELEGETFDDFEDELSSLSEWEFVKSLEDFDDRKSPVSDIPIIFPMANIYYLKGRLDIAQHCADVFSQTFDILVRRSQTRFNVQGEKDTSKLLLGKMYNSLILMLRGHKKVNSGDVLSEFSLDPEDEQSIDDVNFDLSGMTLPDMDDDGPSLPSFDFEADESLGGSESPQADPSQSGGGGFDVSLPDPAMSLDEEGSSDRPKKIKIDVSMASIRNFIRSLQSIDGSWNSNLATTAECLAAVMDQESTESEFIKLGVHYILALQEKDGSWQNDIELTAKILRVLIRINQSMSLGGF